MEIILVGLYQTLLLDGESHGSPMLWETLENSALLGPVHCNVDCAPTYLDS